MTNEDSRDLESPDRPHASTPIARARPDGGTPNPESDSIRNRLETITKLARSLLDEMQQPDSRIDDETRRNVTRRLREIDAEARRVGLELCGPELPIPDGSNAEEFPTVVGCDSLTTTFRGPAPGTLEHLERDREPVSVDELLEGELGDESHEDCDDHGDRDDE